MSNIRWGRVAGGCVSEDSHVIEDTALHEGHGGKHLPEFSFIITSCVFSDPPFLLKTHTV